MKGSIQHHASKRRSGAQVGPRPATINRLKSERVQLELEAIDPGSRVRKIVQRGAHGRFVQPLVLPAEFPGLRIAIRFRDGEGGPPGLGEVVVTGTGGCEVTVKEVARAGA